MDFDLIRYLPGMVKIPRQGQVYNKPPKKVYASPNFVDKKTLELISFWQQTRVQILVIGIFVC